jgi:hypothetical protein
MSNNVARNAAAALILALGMFATPTIYASTTSTVTTDTPAVPTSTDVTGGDPEPTSPDVTQMILIFLHMA